MTKEGYDMSDTKTKKIGSIGTLIIVVVALIGILCLGKLCLNIIKDGKVDYIMDMGRNSGSNKDAAMAGEKGYEDTKGSLQDGTEGTTLLDLKEAASEHLGNNGGSSGSNSYIDDPLVQSVPGNSDNNMDSDVAANVDSDIEDSSSVEISDELTGEEISVLVNFVKYLASTESYMGVALDQYNLPMNDEIVMTAIEIIANDYMSSIPDAEQLVISETHDGGKMTVSKADIDAYAKNLFGYEGISSYGYAGIQDNGDTCDIWCHEGVCTSTAGFSNYYLDGDVYVFEGKTVVNGSSGSDPFFVEVEYTLRVRRNSDSPIGFTFEDLQFGTAEPKY